MNAEYLMPLELLGPGEWADIAELHGEPGWVSRLAELGLHVGSRLKMLRGGSPCMLMIGNSRLCLRGDWAMQILVRPIRLAG